MAVCIPQRRLSGNLAGFLCAAACLGKGPANSPDLNVFKGLNVFKHWMQIMGNRGHDLARTGPALLLASCLLFMAGPLFALASDSHSGSGLPTFRGSQQPPEANELLRLLAQPNG